MKLSKAVKNLFSLSINNGTFRSSPVLFHKGHRHLVDGYEEWLKRQEGMVVSMERTDVLEQIFRKILSEDEAFFLSRFPYLQLNMEQLIERYEDDYSKEEVEEIVNSITKKGFLQLMNAGASNEGYVVPEIIVGWFEFFWMKDREGEMPVEELAVLFEEYLFDTVFPALEDSPYGNDDATRTMRTIVHEEFVPENTCVVDYESAKQIIENTDMCVATICACRHKHSINHPEKESKYPLNACLGLGKSFCQGFVDHGIGKIISKEDALELLKECKDLGLVQNVDNNRKPNFMCNCDPIGCIILRNVRNGFMTIQPSRFFARVIEDRCTGCATCVKKCPLNLYSINRETKKSVLDVDKCIGCGVCATLCPDEAIEMVEREGMEMYVDNVPVDILEKSVRLAFQSRQLHKVVFGDHEKLSHRFGQKVFKMIEDNDFLRKYLVNPDLILKMARKAQQ